MNFPEARTAISDARNTVDRGDFVIRELADLLRGRLRTARVSGSTLAELKRELRDFNLTTRSWKV